MKEVWTGIESSGKSLQLSRKAEQIRVRNKKWFSKVGIKRTMAFNSPMSESFKQLIIDSNINYLEWKNFDDIGYLEEADIFIDELIKVFPANGSSGLSNEQLHFITQGAKSGINVYGASQDFSQVHKQFRLLVNEVHIVKKIIGSRRPMKTAPKVNTIWGICFIRDVLPSSFKGDSVSMETVGMPSFFFIQRTDTERFDTSYKIPLSTLPRKKLRKQVEFCDEDGYTRTRYI
jgi:hypothetical protein